MATEIRRMTFADEVASALVNVIQTYEWQQRRSPYHVLITMTHETHRELCKSANILSYTPSPLDPPMKRFMDATIALVDEQDVRVRFWIEADRRVFL